MATWYGRSKWQNQKKKQRHSNVHDEYFSNILFFTFRHLSHNPLNQLQDLSFVDLIEVRFLYVMGVFYIIIVCTYLKRAHVVPV